MYLLIFLFMLGSIQNDGIRKIELIKIKDDVIGGGGDILKNIHTWELSTQK